MAPRWRRLLFNHVQMVVRALVSPATQNRIDVVVAEGVADDNEAIGHDELVAEPSVPVDSSAKELHVRCPYACGAEGEAGVHLGGVSSAVRGDGRSVSAAVSVAGSGASVMRRHGYGRCVFAHQAGPAIASTEGALCADLVTIGFLQVQFVGADAQHLGEPPLIAGAHAD